jgi:hypothetical protein
MSEESRQRSDRRWAARYARSQAGFDARGRDSDLAGGWVEHLAGPDGVSYRVEVIPPGEPVGKDYWFYFRMSLSFFTKYWFPRASNEDWVVQVRRDPRSGVTSIERFTSYLEALEYVRQTRTVVTTGHDPLRSPKSS